MENDSKEKNNIVKKINDLVTGNVLNNLVYASMITIYFMFFNMYAVFTETEIFIQYIKIASFIFLLFSIFIFEIAYKKDNDEISLNGIEFLVLSIFLLLIQYIPKLLKIDENTYMLAGTYIFLIYYGIKNIIIYTCERKKELDNLSDIKEIVKDEPIKKETKRKEGRTNKFLPDPDVRGAKAYTGDYTKSGYDRGHMAPAADMKWNKQAMEESFYMSNICPQNPNLNRGDWNDLEEKSRQWAKKYGAVYIACGPIYDTKRPKRIGNNKVAVPHAFYKVILINDKKNPQAIGFIFPNSAGHKPLKKYMVTVDSVEKRTDIDFFPALPDEIENRIEAELVQELP